MDIRIRQRLVGALVVLSLVFLIIPVVLDGDGRIPEKITQIPPKPKRPDLSHIRVAEPAQDQLAPLPSVAEAEPGQPSTAESEPAVEAQSTPSTASPENSPAGTEANPTRAWSVQVASFRDGSKASELRDRLRAEGFVAYVNEVMLSDGSLFTQVLVGPEPEIESARARQREIQSSIGEQGLVVRYQP
ncbi:MAG: SPOR domain-containing protein [Saccharospirillum sp.]